MNPPFSEKNPFLKHNIEKLLSLTEKELEEALAPLKFEELKELILNTPWEKRANLILASPYPEGLVQNLPPIELFLTLKATSLDLAVELLSYTKASQIQFIMDFDCWYKDRLKPERVASWIILLFEAGEGKVLEWLSVADWDFLIALMQKFVKIHKRPDDIDLLEAYDYLPPYTLDDVYFVEFKEERLEFYFRRIIEIIREEWPETYFALMESLIWELPLEVEERALRFRNGRLADEGIPDYYTALEVYTYIHPKKLHKYDYKFLPSSEEEASPILYLVPTKESSELFIHKVLTQIKNIDVIEKIQREMAWLATKVTLVDYPVIDSIEEVQKGVYKMWCGLNLGLEYLAGESLELAKEYLENYYLEDIFKVSRTALRELRKFALSLFTNKEYNPTILKYLDQPYAGYLKGVSEKRLNLIKLFNPVNIGTDQEYIEFSRISELRMVRRYLEEIAYMAVLLDRGLGPISEWIMEIDKLGRNFDLNFLTWTSVILTALSQYIYGNEFIFRALPKSAWKSVFSEMVEQKGEKTYLKDSLKEKVYKSFYKLAKGTYYLDEELLRSFLAFVFQRFENEFIFSDPKEPPDPKYQTLILVDLTK
ncbi:MAG: DUF6178 family protein [Caldimicrobium sp.]